MKRALIDADSIIYIIAWNHKESDEVAVKEACDTFLRDILLLTGCDEYIGSFSSKDNFRHELYKFAEYKGNRGEKKDWLLLWEKTIKDHFINKHGFVQPDNVEADDVVAAMAWMCKHTTGTPYVICSPDKDLRQIPGTFYNFAKQGEEQPVTFEVTTEEAHRNYWMQVLTGDTTDNIAGVPGLGEVKAAKLLDTAMSSVQYQSLAQAAFTKYFGTHYGRIIFEETQHTIRLLDPGHPLYAPYESFMDRVFNNFVRKPVTSKGVFDV